MKQVVILFTKETHREDVTGGGYALNYGIFGHWNPLNLQSMDLCYM